MHKTEHTPSDNQPPARSYLSSLVHTMRVHQWVKNLLIFLPAAMAHRLQEWEALQSLMLAALAFCCASSFVYICNDLLDRESDRAHRSKKFRPIASGAVSPKAAVLLALFLGVAAVGLSLALPQRFSLLLLLYVLLTSLYSAFLKRVLVADIVVLASFYSLRVLAGAYAVPVEVSHWLLLFSMFFFFSLASMKRFSELRTIRLAQGGEAKGRGYHAQDLEVISQCGGAAGYLSVLILALYVSSKEVVVLYQHPQLIYLLCPLFLYWITRVWLLAHRGAMHDDPIVFALTDRVSYIVGALAIAILALAN